MASQKKRAAKGSKKATKPKPAAASPPTPSTPLPPAGPQTYIVAPGRCIKHDRADFNEGDEITLDMVHAGPLLAVGALLTSEAAAQVTEATEAAAAARESATQSLRKAEEHERAAKVASEPLVFPTIPDGLVDDDEGDEAGDGEDAPEGDEGDDDLGDDDQGDPAAGDGDGDDAEN